MAAAIYEIKLGDFDIKTCNKVLKAKEYVSFVNASSALSSTKKECANILKRANEESEKIIAEADAKAKKIAEEAKISKAEEEKRGYAAGLEQGKQESANMMMELVTKSSASFSQLEDDIKNIVKSCIRKVIGKVDKNELILSIVKNALEKIKMQKHATIKVAPSEAQFLRDKVTELTKDTPVLEFLDIFSDAHLEPGSCVLETELGVIDASLSVQLQAIESALGAKHVATAGQYNEKDNAVKSGVAGRPD